MAHELWIIKENEMKNITPMVGEIGWQSNIDQLGQELDFNIPFNDSRFFPGKPCEIGDLVLLKNKEEIFRGIIVAEQKNGRQPIQFTVFDFAFYLNKSEGIYQFNGISATKAITQMLRDFNVPMGSIAALPTLINKIYQGQSISEIIKDILDQAEAETGEKYRMEMVAGKLNIQRQADLIVKGTFSLASNLNPYSIQSSISSPSRSQSIVDMKNSVKLVYDNNIVTSLADNDLVKQYGLLQQVIEIDEGETVRAKTIAANALRDMGKILEDNSLSMMGDDGVRAGRMIEIEEEITGMKGIYLIKSCSHTVKNGVHTMSLGLGVI